jgi:hypothetical protein
MTLLSVRRRTAYDVAADRLDPPINWQLDPAGWVRERLGEHPWSKQVQIMESVRDNRHTAVKSCHDTGKSYTAARLASWWIDSHAPGEAFVVTTAPTGAQVKAILWREINRAHRKGGLIGRCNQVEWWIGNEMVAFGRKPADYSPQAFQGIHQRYILIIIDEACGVTKNIWDAVETLATNEHARVLAIGNPDDPATQFFNICQPGTGWAIHQISYLDTPAFSHEAVPPDLLQDLISPLWVEERRQMWGEDSPLWTSKVMGEFPEYAQDTVVPLPMVRRLQAWETWPEEIDPVSELGIDVGAGGDKTVIRHRFGRKPGKQWTDHTADPSNVVSKAMQAIRETGATRAKIDSIGIGWGVAGWLEEKLAEQNINCEVIRVNVGEGSSDPWRFPKLRDEIWWMARELTQDKAWDLRDIDDETLGQLIAPKYKPDTAGRTKVEKKEDTRERIGRSPDNADALNLAFYEPPRVVWSAA